MTMGRSDGRVAGRIGRARRSGGSGRQRLGGWVFGFVEQATNETNNDANIDQYSYRIYYPYLSLGLALSVPSCHTVCQI